MIIESFSWRQKRHLFDVLLYAGGTFRISQLMFGEMFISFKFQICVDRDVVVEYFMFENESLWL